MARDAQESKTVGELCSSSAGFDTKTGIIGSIEEEFHEALGELGEYRIMTKALRMCSRYKHGRLRALS